MHTLFFPAASFSAFSRSSASVILIGVVIFALASSYWVEVKHLVNRVRDTVCILTYLSPTYVSVCSETAGNLIM